MNILEQRALVAAVQQMRLSHLQGANSAHIIATIATGIIAYIIRITVFVDSSAATCAASYSSIFSSSLIFG